MSTIVITTHGTLGDNLPYIALGKALKTRGHEIRMVVNEVVHSYVLKAGLEAVTNGHSRISPEEVRRNAQLWNQLGLLRGQSPDKTKSVINNDDIIDGATPLLKVCHGADMLISDSEQDIFAAVIVDVYDICWVRSRVTPFSQCFSNAEIKHHPYYNSWLNTENSKRFILAASPHFCQLSPEYSHVHQTGFWFYEDSDWSGGEPSEEIREFVEQEPKPLVLSYNSVPVENPQEIVEIHVRAAAKLGRRILIHQGWVDFNQSHLPSDIDRDNVMFANGLIAHDWLFSRAAAAIIHGGIGTIARSLRNGCPVLVEPLAFDQFFNALQVQKLKVGTAMDSEKLTADRVANVLDKKVLTPDYKRRAVEVGEKINAEQGLITACDLIERWLSR
ncbi:glycosyltransferase [Dendronalium sp. ChiSLP03b]|uniref:glycosyltransferase n=1 Tax=Dendronalium sp. ChiSLP03b TaxID=3075381 RepID=UPI002AD331E0|nr:glycosyltransferase [Dendronalium sp. ChiSLP03b]MDZ8207792.1 glycosyltransferase [Dendronalium sp. ChiSLP03b]